MGSYKFTLKLNQFISRYSELKLNRSIRSVKLANGFEQHYVTKFCLVCETLSNYRCEFQIDPRITHAHTIETPLKLLTLRQSNLSISEVLFDLYNII